MHHDPSAQAPSLRDRRAGARKTLLALVIMLTTLVSGSVVFMIREGRNRIPEGRPMLVILPFEAATPGSTRYAGFGEGLATYFSRVDPRDLGVLGPASTTDPIAAFGGDARALGRQLEADVVLMGREVIRDFQPVLVAELLRVESGANMWSEEFDVEGPEALRKAQTRIGAEVTLVLDLAR
jgi:TolB-like protein